MPAAVAAGSSAKLAQCVNGDINPLTLAVCQGGNWVNGNANGSKAHWLEGDFIAYRTVISGLSAGTHTLLFGYDTTNGSKHALDYLGSFDATETTAGGASQYHANNSNPCSDVLPPTQCNPAAPVSSLPVPAANLSGVNAACGTSGTTPGQLPGAIKMFGAAGSSLTQFQYVSQNVTSGGGCTTTVQLTFTTPAAAGTVVIAWGAHIASQLEWGVGNSASNISGSPFHMNLEKLDGASTGDQDRSLSTNAILFTPSLTTLIKNSAGQTVTSVPLGTTVHDTATLALAASNAGGTVTYRRYGNGTCSGDPVATQTVTVNNAAVPNSGNFTPAAPGNYSYSAVYSGDDNDVGTTAACEPLEVTALTPSLTTTVKDSTGATISPSVPVPLGTIVHDTAVLTDGYSTITGSVTYSFFTNGTCSGTPASTQTVTVGASNTVPDSSARTPDAGNYSYLAHYGGDTNNQPADAACEPFSIARAPSSTSTIVFDNATKAEWAGTEVTGAKAYDTATVGTQRDGKVMTGTVTYELFTNGTCTGTASSSQTVTLTAAGEVPNSSPTAALGAGSYGYRATYSGDTNYAGSEGACEPFSVAQASSATSTIVFDKATDAAWDGTEVTGAKAYDTATVTGAPGVAPTGTVTYDYFTTGDCTGSSTSQDVTLAGGLVPNSAVTAPLGAGSYSYRASYSGDANYGSSIGLCEPFTVLKADSITATVVFDNTTKAKWAGDEVAGASAYDTATVSGSPGVTPTGTVTYNYFLSGDCSGSSSSQSVGMAGGLVPDSNPTAALTAGSYSYRADYGGDANYNGSLGACEPFTVGKAGSTTATVVFDNATHAGWTGHEVTGSKAYDTATVTGVAAFAPTGTVTYNLFTTGDCTGAVSTTESATLVAGAVPDSAPTAALAAGSYSYRAAYSGDANYDGSLGDCEPFAVGKAESSTATVVFDDATDVAWAGSEVTGASAYDTATVTGVAGFAPAGTVTYRYFTTGDCTGSSTSQTVSLVGGAVPNSGPTGALDAGNYSYRAAYSGDANYAASTGLCEPFGVGLASTTTATVVFDNATHAAWDGTEVTGAKAYDTATVGPQQDGKVITGTVTYQLFSTGDCNGSSSSQTVTMAGGLVPDSGVTAALAAGSYSYLAGYSGDRNYAASTGECEPFTVAKADSITATVVFDEASGAAWDSTEVTGASAYDTSTVTGVPGFTASGSVTYTLFTGGSCSGAGSTTESVNLTAAGAVPNSSATGALAAGPYSYRADYSGDGNYAASTGECEPFAVGKAGSTTATIVFDDATDAAWSGSEVTGAKAYDTATVTGVAGFTPSGTVSYALFTAIDCTGSSTSQSVTMAGGLVPNSAATAALAAGSYSYRATYSGDDNHNGSLGVCEPFSVGKAGSTTATIVFDDATDAAWSGTEVTGAKAYDTATVTGVAAFAPSGTVSYAFFTTIDCTGSSTSQLMTMAGGVVPNSAATAALATGSYSYRASYSGDGNYDGSIGECEPFAVGKAGSTTATIVFDAATDAAWSGTEVTGAKAYDTATVTGVAGFTPTGTVDYAIFTTIDCTGSSTSQSVTMAGGLVPDSNPTAALAAGSYSYRASYSGDDNHNRSLGECEPFAVGKASSITATVVFDAATDAGWTGLEVTGAKAYDTATVTGVAGFTPAGSVSYAFFNTIDCTGSSSSQSVTMAGGAVPNSAATAALAAGSYSYRASYSGDGNHNGSLGVCEPFSVGKAGSTTATIVFDDATDAAWSGSEVTGAKAYDTATVTGVAGFTPSGTVSYALFTTIDCTGSSTSQSVTMAGGLVPNSAATAALAAGSYSYRATYSGDDNHNGSLGVCEPFSVGKAGSTTATIVFDDATDAAWSGTEVTGAKAYDTATVTGVAGFTPTGSVTYNLFTTGNCTGAASTTQQVTMAGGTVPDSGPTAALAAGSYSYRAIYSGDGNYVGATGACEPFEVGPAGSITATVVFDDATDAAWAGTEVTGAKAYDTATVTGVAGFTPTGSVTYRFFTTGECTGSSTSQMVTLVNGAVPNSSATESLDAGNYSYRAEYSGDRNHQPSTGLCEPFGVGRASTTTATVVFDDATDSAWSGTEKTGAKAYDTATVGPQQDGKVITGTVTYRFFTTGDCTGSSSSQTVTMAGGLVPDSGVTAALAAGSYSYLAGYSGDGNYSASSGVCEPFTVDKAESITATVVFDETTGAAWDGTEVTGASAYDTSTVTGVAGFTPTGSVDYVTFANGACTGTPGTAEDVTLTPAGAVPDSSATGALPAGWYSYRASYSGDDNYAASTGECEPFAVGKAGSTTATVVFDAATEVAWDGSEVTGASAYDTATVTGVAGFAPTGTVDYAFFTTGDCTGASSSQSVTMAGGVVPDSAATVPLAAGSYSYRADYSGDGNYTASIGECEPFAVGKAGSSAATAVFDDATDAAWAGTEVTGAKAYDTTTVTGVEGFTPTGSVSYAFFTNGGCSGSPVSTEAVTMAGGGVPDSAATPALSAGGYSYRASYSGDANYDPATGECEPFSLAKAAATTATVVFDAATGAAWAGTEVTGAKAYDTATVTGVAGFTPTGTVDYAIFTAGDCTGSSTSQSVTMAGGAVPGSDPTAALAAGSYSYRATYSGDSNYTASIGECEPFAVGKAGSSAATVVFDDATDAAWTGTEVVGASAYDTATVAGVAGFIPTGTVSYTLFTDGLCTASAASITQTVSISVGLVPNSAASGALAAGSYSYRAVYSGDGNHNAAIGECEPFSVNAAAVAGVTTTRPAAPQAVPQPAVAFTGADLLNLLLAAVVLVGAGGSLAFGARRRRRGGAI